MNPGEFAPGTPFQKWKCLMVALIKTRAGVCILQLKPLSLAQQSLNFSVLEVRAEITLPRPNPPPPVP